METTLILLKPDCVTKSNAGEVLKRFEAASLQIRGIKMLQASDAILAEHYAHIAQKPFFPEVRAFMQSSPIIAVALAGEGAIDRVRELLGPTDSRKAAPGTIRADLGIDVMVNVCHASDSADAAKAELARFFRPEELFSYELAPVAV